MMSWTLTRKPETVKVTKILASRFSEMTALPRERPLRERRLVIYRKLIEQGLFRPITWASCHCVETGEEYRVNGQHTSSLMAGMQALPELFVTVERYTADTLEDVAHLWSTFDSQVAARNSREIYAATASCIQGLETCPLAVICVAVVGINFGLFQEEATRKRTPAERAEELFDHPDFAMWLHDEIEIKSEKAEHLMRGPVVGAMFTTWSKSEKSATTFWHMVRDETGEHPDLPDRVLARWLRRMRVVTNNGTGGRTSATGKRMASGREFYVKCLHGWNAWRKSEKTDLKYYPTAKLPNVV